MHKDLLKIAILSVLIHSVFLHVFANPEAERLKQHLDSHGHILVEDNTLMVIYEGEASSVEFCCTIQEHLTRLDDSDIWVLRKKIPNLAELVIGYTFILDGGFPQDGISIWRGSKAPKAPEERESPPMSRMLHTLDSEILGESREIYVYLPPNHESLKWGFDLPVVYVADNGSIGNQANYIEALIRQGKLPAMLLIAIEGGKGNEYISFETDGAFELHERFIIEDVLPWAETKFGASTEPKDRAIYGQMDGGIFAATMGIRNPDIFRHTISFSLGVNPTFFDKTLSIDSKHADANFYFLAAKLEEGPYNQTKELAQQLAQEGINSVFESRVAGLDYIFRGEAFPEAVLWAFGIKE